ncbi:MAG: hypothetical protein Q9182_005943 [Xanthomendoza sp. 2 TL-2023]
MRVSTVLTAALSFTTVIAFPLGSLEPWQGNELVRRGGEGSRSSHKGGSGHKSSKGSSAQEDPKTLPGNQDRGTKHPKAPATDKKRVDKVVSEGTKILRENKRPIEISDKKPEPGVTGIHEVTRSDGTKRFDGYLGDDMAEHTQGVKDRERRYPNSATCEYRFASKEDHKNRRPKTTGDGPPNPKDPKTGEKSDAVKEEKPAAGMELVPVNVPKDDMPPPTVIIGSGPVSRERDNPLMKMLQQATKDAGPGATMTFRSNASGKVKLPEAIPVKGPSSDAYIETKAASSSAGKLRKDPSGNKFRTGSSSGSGSESDGSRRNTKRDAFDMVADSQTNAESSQPVQDSGEEMLANMEEYIEALGAVKKNATEMIMPFIKEMVNGSNNEVVWYAAWEIMSLADPSIMVIGGPVFRGMHAFDWFEDSIINKTDEQTMTSIYATNKRVIDLYQATWNKANDALTGAGLSQNLDVLSALTANQTLDESATEAANDYFVDGLNSLPAGNSTSTGSVPQNGTALPSDSSNPASSPSEKSIAGENKAPVEDPTTDESLPKEGTALPSDSSTPASSPADDPALKASLPNNGTALPSDTSKAVSSPGEKSTAGKVTVSGKSTTPDEDSATEESLPNDGTAPSTEDSNSSSPRRKIVATGEESSPEESLPNDGASLPSNGSTTSVPKDGDPVEDSTPSTEDHTSPQTADTPLPETGNDE